MPVVTQPMQIILADLIFSFVKLPLGNKDVLSPVYHSNGWDEANPNASKSSEEVWQCLTRHFSLRHTYPEVILADLGLEFEAHVLDFSMHWG